MTPRLRSLRSADPPRGSDGAVDAEHCLEGKELVGNRSGNADGAPEDNAAPPLRRRPHQRQIGQRIGVSQMQTSRIIRHSIARLRAAAAHAEQTLQ
jgi:hypothetical protein